jgi:hypothetical protein
MTFTMTFKRHVAASILIASVVLGGLVAPFSHFAYMAVSERFNPRGMEVGSSHGAHLSALSAAGISAITEASDCAEECAFAAFVMNQAPACHVAPILSTSPTRSDFSFVSADESWHSTLPSSSHARGPPALSGTVA